MWLLRAWHNKTGLPIASTPLHFYLSRWHSNSLFEKTSMSSFSNFVGRNISSYSSYSSRDVTHWNNHLLRNVSSCKINLSFGIYYHHIASINHLVNILKQPRSNKILIPKTFDVPSSTSIGSPLQKIESAHLHVSSCIRGDIPDYLRGNVSEVSSLEDFDQDLEDEFNNDMEDEILDFLNSRLLSYEEGESNFTLPCPSCLVEDQNTRSQEIFVDKNSGYFVCPWCCRAGTWEELRQLLDQHEDSITAYQLSMYLSTASNISDIDLDLLQESPLQAVSLPMLEKCGAKLTSDETRIVFPLKSDTGDTVGFESVSLIHDVPQVIRRYVAGEPKPLFIVDNLKDRQKIIVVSNCCNVLTLAEYGIPAVSIPFNDIDILCEHLSTMNKREVYLWLDIKTPPRQLVQFLIDSQIPAMLVKLESGESPIYKKSLSEVQMSLKNLTPILTESITTFSELKDQIYRRLTNKEETCGVQWKRFSELNDVLLGHRLGEMTVLTGPTGSGKTTLMAEYSLDLCSQGVVTLWGSFEISVVRLCEIMLQQYSGGPLPVNEDSYHSLASEFSALPLHFLTYHGQQTTKSVLEAMTKAVKVWGIQHIIIDNLQFMLGTCERSIDRWWEQDKAVAAFRRFATLNNCHVSLIVHPKKVPEGQMLGVESVFGGAKVTQEADNVLILQVKHTNNINQTKKALQIVKNRYGGQLGVVPLKFHRESLTLSSHFSQKPKGDKEKQSSNTNKVCIHKKVKGLKAFTN